MSNQKDVGIVSRLYEGSGDIEIRRGKYWSIERQLIGMRHQLNLILATLDAERLREMERECEEKSQKRDGGAIF